MAGILPSPGTAPSPTTRFSGDAGMADAFQKLVNAQMAAGGQMGGPLGQSPGMMPGGAGLATGGPLNPAALQQLVQILGKIRGA